MKKTNSNQNFILIFLHFQYKRSVLKLAKTLRGIRYLFLSRPWLKVITCFVREQRKRVESTIKLTQMSLSLIGCPIHIWPCITLVLWWKTQAGNTHLCKNEINNSLKNANLLMDQCILKYLLFFSLWTNNKKHGSICDLGFHALCIHHIYWRCL